MNNGVTNTNQPNTNEQPVLMPMEGVTIAPASEAPVNASVGSTVPTATAPQIIAQIPTQNSVPSNVSIAQPAPAAVIPQATQPMESPVVTTPNGPTPPVSPPPVEVSSSGTVGENPPQKKTKKLNITPFLIVAIILLAIYAVYSNQTKKAELQSARYNCTPITASKEETKLDLNSTLVQDLYRKVSTNIREDLAQPEFNDEMKLYLAYRQITERDKYDTNCNLFSNTAMEPYTCEVSTAFIPKAFKEETLKQEVKKLFGENTNLAFKNIQLGTSCIVGYQYIAARGEFVEGTCNQKTATSYSVTKTLTKAISTRNTIILTEEVTYKANEKMDLPTYLKNGIYYYTFRLDMNYNYVLISKQYESKY